MARKIETDRDKLLATRPKGNRHANRMHSRSECIATRTSVRKPGSLLRSLHLQAASDCTLSKPYPTEPETNPRTINQVRLKAKDYYCEYNLHSWREAGKASRLKSNRRRRKLPQRRENSSHQNRLQPNGKGTRCCSPESASTSSFRRRRIHIIGRCLRAHWRSSMGAWRDCSKSVV